MNDIIKREDAIQTLVGITAYNSVEEIQAACFDSYAKACGWLGGVRDSIAALEEVIPAADVRPVVYGEWINKRHGVGWCCAECSICGNRVIGKTFATGFGFEYKFPKLCDDCGADMRGGADG